MIIKKLISFLTILTVSGNCLATMTDEVKLIQSQWAEVNYMPEGEAKEKAFENLSKLATQTALKKENQPEALVWEGIIYSSFAGAKGGLGALSLAKHAKKSYEEAIRINGNVLDGSAYTSLGVLYSKAPGWPIGFGSDKKAVKNLKRGLAMNPEGIDSNFFYGQYLVEEEDDFINAKIYLERALKAPNRPDRFKADLERRKEIKSLLSEVNQELLD